MLRVPFEELYGQFLRVLLKIGFARERAELCARLFAETSRDGLYTHGLNRFPRFIEYIKKGYVDIHAEPEMISELGIVEQWDGRLGPGNLNAWTCMDRAMALAKERGLGCVALRNTNHWIRAGTYGWQAAEQGFMAIAWTNTTPNMPAWGTRARLLGNNPLMMAIPRSAGHIVLDMAMSLFSYGKLEAYRKRGELLPYEGGFDESGRLTRDPAAIEKSYLGLPIGFWKGSGLSLMLDLMAAILSGGHTSLEIGRFGAEYGVSQVFFAIDVSRPAQRELAEKATEEIIRSLHRAPRMAPGERVYYPGERTLETRQQNLKLGIPVDETYWRQVLEM